MMPDPSPGGPPGGGPPEKEAAEGINALEGYLLWQAETSRARECAGRFTERLPWLTSAQREEIERVYVRDHLDQAVVSLRATATRAEELGREYQDAYRVLRRRLTAGFALVMSMVVGLVSLLLAAR